MKTQFRHGKVMWFDRNRGVGKLVDLETSFSEVEFSVAEGRRPQVIVGRIFYASEMYSKRMPEPQIGDILLFESHPGVQTVARLWGYQREFFLEIWKYIRSHEDWCPACGHPKNLHAATRDGCSFGYCCCEIYYRDGLDELLRQQMIRDMDADIEAGFDLIHEFDDKVPNEGEDWEPQQVWFTEGPMGHNGYA